MSAHSPLRIIFAGTPEFAALHLQCLLDSHHEIVAVYTQPDRPAGRGKKLQASAVKHIALQADIPVHQPLSLKDEEAQALLASFDADLMIVVAYGLLLPQAVLDTPKYGCFNVHGSILPRWRGAAPIQRAIEAGDEETGITIMQMDAGLDTGAMLHKAYCPIKSTDTTISLHATLAELGQSALLQTLDKLCNNTLVPEAQDNHQATYAHKLSKEEGKLDWQQSTALLMRKIRAFNPFPICYTTLESERLRIFEAKPSQATPSIQDAIANQQQTAMASQAIAPGTIISHANQQLHIATGDGAIAVAIMQLPGKKALPCKDLLNGMSDKLAVGIKLGK